MNEKVKKVFELLGVEPNEEFKIERGNKVYRITEYLTIQFLRSDKLWSESSGVRLINILNGNNKIIKIPKLTEADKNAIRYLRDGGIRYVARDKNGNLCAFKGEPYKEGKVWYSQESIYYIFENLFQFIRWEDEEPFCIDDEVE